MATIKKISALPAATAATTADLMPIVQGGVTKQLSFGSLMGSPTLFGSGVATFLATPSSANLNAALTTKTGTGLAVFDTSPTLASPTVTAPTVSGGNLSFSGTAQRITGDMSNATVANRLMFQTSTANSNTGLGIIPNGTAVTANVRVYNSSDPNNASTVDMNAVASSDARFSSGITGTGTYLPMTFYTGGSEAMRISTARNVAIGIASDAVDLLQIHRGSGSGVTSGISLTTAAGGVGDGSYIKWTGAVTAEKIARIDGVLEGTDLGSIRFNTGNGADGFDERMRIDSSGNVEVFTGAAWVASGIGPTGKQLLFGYDTTNSIGYVRSANNGTAYTPLYLDGSIVRFNVGTASLTEAMRIDASGNVNIATLGARITGDFSNATVSNRLAFQSSTTNGNTGVYIIPNGTSTTAAITVANNSNPTSASIGILQATATQIVLASTTTGSGTILPLSIQTSGSEKMRIDISGNIIAGASAALATTAADGFLYVPTCAGVPTGTPTAITGMAPIVVDTTNNRWYFYSNGAWRNAGP